MISSKTRKISDTSFSVKTKGGNKRKIFLSEYRENKKIIRCSIARSNNSLTSTSNSIAIIKPLPRISRMILCLFFNFSNPDQSIDPIFAALSIKPSSVNAVKVAAEAAHARGFPPNVEDCSPFSMLSKISGFVSVALNGIPPARPFEVHNMSGITFQFSHAHIFPVRPKPHCTSSKTRTIFFPSVGFSLESVVDPTGAGDSFAGAMIGHLAAKKKTNFSEIKKSIIYGNVMGSFAVEKYGLAGLTSLKKSDITKRIKQYEKMVTF